MEPETKSKRINIEFNEAQLSKIQKLADNKGVSVPNIIRLMVTEYPETTMNLDRYKKPFFYDPEQLDEILAFMKPKYADANHFFRAYVSVVHGKILNGELRPTQRGNGKAVTSNGSNMNDKMREFLGKSKDTPANDGEIVEDSQETNDGEEVMDYN